MNNEINFFDFWKLIWTKKIFITIFSILFLFFGILLDYYQELITDHYQGTLIIYPLSKSESLPLERIRLASENNIYEKNGCSGLGCNFQDEASADKDFLIDYSPVIPKLLEEFYSRLMSIEFRMEGLKAVNYLENTSELVSEFEKENSYLSDYKDNFFHNFVSDNFYIEKFGDDKIVIILKHSDYKKLHEYIDWLATNIIKDININFQNLVNDTLLNLQKDKIDQQKILESQLEQLKNYNFPKKDILRYAISQKVIFFKIDYIIERINNAYEISGIQNMTFKPVHYDTSSIVIEKIDRYEVNYSLLCFFAGIFLSIMMIIIRRSYLVYKNNNLIREKE